MYRSEEGDKELEKERERITPFITFQQVTTTSTNASSSKSVLPSTQPSESVISKIMTTLTTTTVNRKEKLQLTSTKETISSILPRSTVEEITDVPSTNESSNTMSLIASPDLLQSGGVDLHHHINGDSLGDTQELTVADTVPTISSPQISTISMVHDLMDGASLDQVAVRNPTTPTPMPAASPTSMVQHMARDMASRRDIITTRLNNKRPYMDVDDIVVTSSAKRSIVPTAFITSYSPLHQSPPLNSKQLWATETTTMIIDQHNNNG